MRIEAVVYVHAVDVFAGRMLCGYVPSSPASDLIVEMQQLERWMDFVFLKQTH